MKKILFVLLISGYGFVSCNKEPQPLTKQEIKQKIDSITKVRIIQSDELAQTDLERRIKIEVKVKADSIANILQHGGKIDTAAKAAPSLLTQRPAFGTVAHPPAPARK